MPTARGGLVHGLRHTFATELANSDVSVYTLNPANVVRPIYQKVREIRDNMTVVQIARVSRRVHNARCRDQARFPHEVDYGTG
jgi:hypothetical protein